MLGLALGGATGPLACTASAAGNASTAAAFVENAQNQDGGFGAERGQSSSPEASLWATVALLAAGKNPQDEQLNNGSTADDYLASHVSAYRTLSDLGLLAIVQSASALSPARYGDPGAQLISDETISAIRRDPGGAALGILGLLAINSQSARRAAKSAAQTLLAAPDSDGGWGFPASTSQATALVLQALAQGGVADAGNRTVFAGIAYLHKAQLNDGSIGFSDRTDPSSTGDVGATAFAIQAVRALGVPSLRTPTGTTLLQGLLNYQQQGTGGLSPYGAYDTGVAPSVIDTAQAYPAFDGVTFPLPVVPNTAPQPAKKSAPSKPKSANRISTGSTSGGISSNTASGTKTVGAYKGASAAGSAKSHGGKGAAGSGTSVTGQEIGTSPAPKLTTRSGRNPGTDYTGLLIAGALAAFALLGGALDARRPRRDPRSPVAVAVQSVASFLAAARARRAATPFATLLVGATLIAIPVQTQMFSRAPKGATMIAAFAPYMRAGELDRLQRDVSQLNSAVREGAAKGPALQDPNASTAEDAHKQFVASDPQLVDFDKQWPAIHERFLNLLDPIKANAANYRAIAALPSFKLFPWFFVVPGGILIALAALCLLLPRLWRRMRWGIVAVGLGLVLAPLVLQMYDRGPSGAHLVTAFRKVETRANLTAAQNGFASITVGQSALETELLPAIGKRGLDRAEIAQQLPAVTTLDSRYVRILGDITPLLGVMADNVVNYQAVAALPAFNLFPWLFAIPGLLALALVLTARGTGRPAFRRRRRAPESQPARPLTSEQGAR